MVVSVHLVASLCLAKMAIAQPSGIACCDSKGITLERAYCSAPSSDGVSTWSEVETCWDLARSHFANKTASDGHQIFQVLFSSEVEEIRMPPEAPVLEFDADLLPEDGEPELGYLPYKLQFLFPKTIDGLCQYLQLADWKLHVTKHGGNALTRKYQAWQMSFAGCSQDLSYLHNLSLKSHGYGSPEFDFVTLEDSHDITSVEFVDEEEGDAPQSALIFLESVIRNCTIRYFGDVSGDFGNTYGRTQDGCQLIDSQFLVQDPLDLLPFFTYRTSKLASPYIFEWYGALANGLDMVHMQDSHIEYIRDVQLGTVQIQGCQFEPWIKETNPVISSKDVGTAAASFELYRADMGGEGQKTFGSMMRDSVVGIMWGVRVDQSATENATFVWRDWSQQGSPPQQWMEQEARIPSFNVMLNSTDPNAGFPQVMTGSLGCLRPEITFKSGDTSPIQQILIAEDSLTPGTRFLNYTSEACAETLHLQTVSNFVI